MSWVLLSLRVVADGYVTDREIRGGVMPLQADDTGLETATLARAFRYWPGIAPVAHLKAIYPHRHVTTIGDDGLAEPLVVAGNDSSRRLVPIETAGSEVH